MTIYFVTRHEGALQWATEHNITFDIHLAHLSDLSVLQAGDVVIGTLPMQMVATLNSMQVQYVNLSLQIPAQWRGKELSAEQLVQCHAQLEVFHVRRQAFHLDMLRS